MGCAVHGAHLQPYMLLLHDHSSSNSAKHDTDIHTHFMHSKLLSNQHSQWAATTHRQENTVTEVKSRTHCCVNKCPACPLHVQLRIKSNACNPNLIYHHTASFCYYHCKWLQHSLKTTQHGNVTEVSYTLFCAILYRWLLNSHVSSQSPLHLHTCSKTAPLST